MCKNGKCEYVPTVERKIAMQRTLEEILYGRLWAEIEMPQELKEKEMRK